MSSKEYKTKDKEIRHILEVHSHRDFECTVKLDDTSVEGRFKEVRYTEGEFTISLKESPGVLSGITQNQSLTIEFASHIIDSYCKFQSKFINSVNTDLKMAIPEKISCLQRRVNIRVKPPSDKPVEIEFRRDEKRLNEPVISLSAKGQGFLMDQDIDLSEGDTLDNITLVFPDNDKLERKGRVCSVKETEDNEKRGSVVFTDLHLGIERRIRNYISEVMC